MPLASDSRFQRSLPSQECIPVRCSKKSFQRRGQVVIGPKETAKEIRQVVLPDYTAIAKKWGNQRMPVLDNCYLEKVNIIVAKTL